MVILNISNEIMKLRIFESCLEVISSTRMNKYNILIVTYI